MLYAILYLHAKLYSCIYILPLYTYSSQFLVIYHPCIFYEYIVKSFYYYELIMKRRQAHERAQA
ncbi:membrane protein [gut metagenome]|uniref:Membrane protein n=1 Tax=gut metagenome TaxID=749906 RepID=J9GJ02_9ZZZZ